MLRASLGEKHCINLIQKRDWRTIYELKLSLTEKQDIVEMLGRSNE